MYEATFRIPASQPYAAVTAKSDGTIELWCNDHCDLLYVTASIADSVHERVQEVVEVREHVARDPDHVIVTDECLRNYATSDVDSYLRDHGCLLRPPLQYHNGEKICHILAVDPESLTALYRDLVEEYSVAVDAKREVTQPTPWDPRDDGEGTQGFTDRQREVLTVAYDAGYYEIPRETTTAEVAETFDLDRRTVEEHLRRAENKLVSSAVRTVRF